MKKIDFEKLLLMIQRNELSDALTLLKSCKVIDDIEYTRVKRKFLLANNGSNDFETPAMAKVADSVLEFAREAKQSIKLGTLHDI